MLKNLVKFAVKDSHLKSLGARASRPVGGGRQQRRELSVHENAAYGLLRSAGIPTPEYGLAKSPAEAKAVAGHLDSRDLVLKAQVLAGGRAKGKFVGSDVAGVLMCDTPEAAQELAAKMLGKKLVTKQTGEAGRICNAVMLTRRVFARKELYLSVMMERSFAGPVIITSRQGGVNIEDVAEATPEAITYTPVDIRKGLSCEQADKIACSLGVPEVALISEIICNLYELFVAKDALLLEINPLVQDICGQYYALDCKCSFDDSAEFRQKELFALQDWSQKNPSEAKADKFGLNYIALDGNIGCMVNGAGLAMATMDIIKLYGGEPANFLDVGGGASVKTVTEAFKIITGDPKVESIFVNIFGGIMRCDIIAEGIVTAFKELQLKVPVIVRLQGTNAELGKKLILDAKLKIIPIDDMAEAAEASVSVADICRLARNLNLDLELTPKPGKDKC